MIRNALASAARPVLNAVCFTPFATNFHNTHTRLPAEDCHYPLRRFPQDHPKGALLNNLPLIVHPLTHA